MKKPYRNKDEETFLDQFLNDEDVPIEEQLTIFDLHSEKDIEQFDELTKKSKRNNNG